MAKSNTVFVPNLDIQVMNVIPEKVKALKQKREEEEEE